MTYDNDQQAATLWDHDHALGITRLNVYAGLAGFYVLQDENRLELVKVGELFVEYREVDVQTPVRYGWNALVEPTFEVDDRVDPDQRQGGPVGNHRRDIQVTSIVHLEELQDVDCHGCGYPKSFRTRVDENSSRPITAAQTH